MAAEENKEWVESLGLNTIVAKDWERLSRPQEAHSIIREFVDTDAVVISGRQPMTLTMDLVKVAMGLADEGDTAVDKTYTITDEVPRKGAMHQLKDGTNPHRHAQLQFYLQNIVLMAKNEDMSAKNYSRLRAVKEGATINWAALYIENLKKRAANALESGGPTLVHKSISYGSSSGSATSRRRGIKESERNREEKSHNH